MSETTEFETATVQLPDLLKAVRAATGVEPVRAWSGGLTVLVVDMPDGRVLTIGDIESGFVIRTAADGSEYVEADGFTVDSYPTKNDQGYGSNWTRLDEIRPDLSLLTSLLFATEARGLDIQRVTITIDTYFPTSVTQDDLEKVAASAVAQIDEPEILDEDGAWEADLPAICGGVARVQVIALGTENAVDPDDQDDDLDDEEV